MSFNSVLDVVSQFVVDSGMDFSPSLVNLEHAFVSIKRAVDFK